jgi:DNA-directed RNA polymerase specialized sigma24 family protein
LWDGTLAPVYNEERLWTVLDGDPEGGVAMSSEGAGSVTCWFGPLQGGDPDAAQQLWARYIEALVRLARAKLRATPRTAADEEDVALSAFDSFCRGMKLGRYPQLEDRDNLWRLLVTITARKAADLVQWEHRQKRGAGRVRVASDVGRGDQDMQGDVLDRIAGPEPTPEFAALVAEELRRRLDGLGDEMLRQVAQLKLEGWTDEEIAAQLGCTRRTVVRKLVVIRQAWMREVPL